MVYLIIGSPSSGKSTYIRRHAKDGDIICDPDLIYEAIGGTDPWDPDLWVHETALRLADQLRDIIRERSGGWKDAYVVTIANTAEGIQRDAERIRADIKLFIDTPMGECLRRAKDRPLPYKMLIREWHETRSFKWPMY